MYSIYLATNIRIMLLFEHICSKLTHNITMKALSVKRREQTVKKRELNAIANINFICRSCKKNSNFEKWHRSNYCKIVKCDICTFERSFNYYINGFHCIPQVMKTPCAVIINQMQTKHTNAVIATFFSIRRVISSVLEVLL